MKETKEFGKRPLKIRQRICNVWFDAEYVMNAEEIEIKVGQGAKPGEGGHLPGYKVDPMIARMRKRKWN